MATWRQPGQSLNYDYSQGPRPGSIDWEMQRRARAEQLQDELYANQESARIQNAQELALAAQKESIATDEQVKRNRMGLGGLQPMLNDRYSDAYEWGDASGQAIKGGVDISVGGLDGSAPAPLPERPRRLGLQRLIRPEFKPALDAMRTEDAVGVNKVSPYENPMRERETNIKALQAVSDTLEMMDEADPSYPILVKQRAELAAKIGQQPAAQEPVAPATAPAPAPAKTGGITTLEVGPVGGSGESVLEEKPGKGKIVKRGNRAIYVRVDGTEQDVTEQAKQAGMI